MTWTNDPKPNPKKILQVLLTDINALVLPSFVPIIWPFHESPPLGVHLLFKVWPLCSPLSVVIDSFCSLNIRFKFWTKSWSVFFSSSPFGSHGCSFDPFSGRWAICLAFSYLVNGYLIPWHCIFPEIYLPWGFLLLSCYLHLCPRWVFNFSWPVWFFKLQFIILDQISDLVFKCIAIFCWVARDPSIVGASNINIIDHTISKMRVWEVPSELAWWNRYLLALEAAQCKW